MLLEKTLELAVRPQAGACDPRGSMCHDHLQKAEQQTPLLKRHFRELLQRRLCQRSKLGQGAGTSSGRRRDVGHHGSKESLHAVADLVQVVAVSIGESQGSSGQGASPRVSSTTVAGLVQEMDLESEAQIGSFLLSV